MNEEERNDLEDNRLIAGTPANIKAIAEAEALVKATEPRRQEPL